MVPAVTLLRGPSNVLHTEGGVHDAEQVAQADAHEQRRKAKPEGDLCMGSDDIGNRCEWAGASGKVVKSQVFVCDQCDMMVISFFNIWPFSWNNENMT